MTDEHPQPPDREAEPISSVETASEVIATGPLCLVGACLIAAQLLPLANGHYGWFIDEFYCFACADRLDWGYVDHPPLSIALLAIVRAVFGDSLLAARAMAAICGAATVWIGGAMAQRLGAGRRGQLLAGTVIACTPLLIVISSFYSMNAIEVVLLSACCLLLLDVLQRGESGRWKWVGLVIGIALLNKHTAILFAVGLAAGVLMTPHRRALRERALWIGVGLAVLVVLPNLVWQAQHGWVSLDFYRNAGAKNIATSPLQALLTQVLSLNPGSLPIWGAGVWLLLRDARVRPLGVLFTLVFLGLVLLGQSRQDRIAGLVPLVMAAGAAYWDARASRAVGRVLFAAPLAISLVLAPVFIPVLPPTALARYAARLGVVPELEVHSRALALPQWLADRVGWEGYVHAIEDAYAGLPEAERNASVIITRSYGSAGSLELLGRGLPPVYAVHNSYHSWGPPKPFEVAIVVQFSERELLQYFESVVRVGEYQCEYCRQWSDPTPIYVVRGPKRPIAEVWKDLARYI